MPISKKEVKLAQVQDKKTAFTFSPQRTIQWIGGVNGSILADVTDKIHSLILESPTEAIHLIVTSHGGPSGIGMSFYDSMRSIYKPNLVTIGSGDVDSSGIVIFLAGEKRYLTPNTTMLLHLAGRTFDTPKRFTTPEMESIVKEDKMKDFQYASIISERTNGQLTIQEVLDLMANNTVLTPADAVELGIAHAII